MLGGIVTAMSECAHLDAVVRSPGLLGPPAQANGCEDCLPERTDWLHLRRCLQCGRILCCEGSPQQHAKAHAGSTSHGLVQSFEPGEDWVWCYDDDVLLRPSEGIGSPSHNGRREL